MRYVQTEVALPVGHGELCVCDRQLHESRDELLKFVVLIGWRDGLGGRSYSSFMAAFVQRPLLTTLTLETTSIAWLESLCSYLELFTTHLLYDVETLPWDWTTRTPKSLGQGSGFVNIKQTKQFTERRDGRLLLPRYHNPPPPRICSG